MDREKIMAINLFSLYGKHKTNRLFLDMYNNEGKIMSYRDYSKYIVTIISIVQISISIYQKIVEKYYSTHPSINLKT